MNSISANPPDETQSLNSFPIVGIGASAGGLEALKQFFRATPPDTGLAFVLVQHLDPNHQSLMADLLAKYTTMPVAQVIDGLPVKPNHVYVIPPNHYLVIQESVLRLSPPTERRGMRMPIDHFLRSLAEDQGEKALCVILSGTGSDGTLGLREIKGRGGMTIVQEPATAQYGGMPHSALATGLVDYCLAVEDIPQTLVRYVQHPYVRGELPLPTKTVEPPDDLDAVISIIRARTGHDFRHYKKGTLGRRIARRMGLATIEKPPDYLKLLQASRDEIDKLVRDLLISVTSFFREPEAFETLRTEIAPSIVEQIRPEEPIRLWVPGCASGEEAYSLAMLFIDAIRQSEKSVGLQVFATDIDVKALEIARAGIYPAAATTELPPDYLQYFFTRDGEQVSVNKSVRETVVFAAQNLITDPPFSRLHLISCRNLLIYLDSEIQTNVIRLFHFALRDGGYLFLGNSETIGPHTDLFQTLSKKWRLYRRLNGPISAYGPDYYRIASDTVMAAPRNVLGRAKVVTGRRIGEQIEAKLLKEYAPAAVLVDRAGQALFFHGATSRYLEMPTGTATHELIALARESLRPALRTTLQKAMRTQTVIEARRIALHDASSRYEIRLKIWPVNETEGTFLICFEDEKETEPTAYQVPMGEETLVKHLEHELKATREDLQTTIEEAETTNEELKAANEEVMSMNEELQSTNEELETSREELQSLNEELSTVNNQLLDKVHDLESANNDLANLLSSTEIATIFLDADLRVRRYTPSATRLFAFIEADHGRSIADVVQRFQDGVLIDHCQQVMHTLQPFQEEVCDHQGNWFLLRILPYRTLDQHIDGVVMTFSDITEIKNAYAAVQDRERQIRVITDALPILIAHIDVEHRFQFVNGAYERWFGLSQQNLLGEPLCQIFGIAAYESLCPLIERTLQGETCEATAHLTHRRLGERDISTTCVPELTSAGQVMGFYLLIRDVTEQKKIEQRLMAANTVFRSTTEAAAILDDERHFTMVNPAFEAMTGYALNQCVGENWGLLIADHPSPTVSSAIWECVKTQASWHGEAWLRRKSGEVFAAWLTVDAIRPETGGVRGYVVVFADISTVKETEKRLEFLAHHDPLSGLVNRVMFHERLAHSLARAQRQNSRVALLYLDLDGFKHINDSFGHEVGDRVLELAAARLKTCMRAGDTLARLGGDEFGVLLEEITESWSAALVAAKIIEELDAPFVVNERELALGVSVGISLFPADGDEASVLIRNADTAMYRAKARGGNVAHFYTPSLTENVQQRVATETALRQAVDTHELELHFQPIIALDTQRIIGAEALLRWRAPSRGVLLPDSFLPIAELSGLILQIGRQVIELACTQLAAWRAQALVVPRLSINVSARQCMDENFPVVFKQILDKHSILTTAIDLEITESCFLDRGTSHQVLLALQQLGVTLTIDDFGTRYATFTSLQHVPVSAIKIDRAFVNDITGGKSNGAIAKAIIALGQSQNLRVVAEGVETEVQLQRLAQMGCDAGQGYLIAPPLSADLFCSWLQTHAQRVDAF
ncbi:MAG: EAL domain-containing protein [Gammaproteobacteria bacterium]|nr:EAL domain-containing protein [Gammaproteobacteria bacterium]